MPSVSVIMAVYNAMPYLPETVASILGQTLQDFRFIIVDDGSTDRSPEYLASLTDSRIEVLRQTNAGPAAARNAALERVQTEFVAVIDADDVALPNRLERQVEFLRSKPEIGLAGSQIEYLGDSGRHGFPPPLPRKHEEIVEELLGLKHGIANCSVIARTALIKGVGGYPNDSDVYGCEDWGLFFRLLDVTRLANMDEMLQLYRVNHRSLSGTRMARIRAWCAYLGNCYKERRAGRPEPSFQEFEAKLAARPLLVKIAERLDFYSFNQYRLALADLLSPRWPLGYARLAYAGLASPGRSIGRIRRAVSRVAPWTARQ
jgi:glycosyltransferase involved in cell wall biosynthesis